jgi:hypothetical protein
MLPPYLVLIRMPQLKSVQDMGIRTEVAPQAPIAQDVDLTPLLQKSEAFSLRVSKGEAVVGYCDPLIARRMGASGFPAG